MQVDCPRCGASNDIDETSADDVGRVRTACHECEARLLIKVNRPNLKVNPAIPETEEEQAERIEQAAQRVSVLDAGFEIDVGADATDDSAAAWLAVVVHEASGAGVADLRGALMGVRRFRANPNKLHDATAELPFIFDQLTDSDVRALSAALETSGARWEAGPRSSLLDTHGAVLDDAPLAAPPELVIAGDEDEDPEPFEASPEPALPPLDELDDEDIADEPGEEDEDLASALAAALSASDSFLNDDDVRSAPLASSGEDPDASQAVFVDESDFDEDAADALFAATETGASFPPPAPKPVTLYREPALPPTDPVRLDRPVLLTGLSQVDGRVRPLQLVTACVLVRPDERSGRISVADAEQALTDVLLKLEQAARGVGANVVLGVSTNHGPTGGAPGADLMVVAQGTAASRD